MNASPFRIFGIATLFLTSLFSIQHTFAASGSKAGNRKDTYIALSFSHETRSYGYATKQKSKSRAIKIAKRECRKHANDCSTKHTGWTNNTCISIATDARGGWGIDNGSSKRKARQNAVKNCASYKGNYSCKPLFTICQ